MAKRKEEEEALVAGASDESSNKKLKSKIPQTPHATASLPQEQQQMEIFHNSSTLYLDTVQRHRLDFDFEKLCCVSLSNLNVYACLVCGKYYQGRGKSSHAYFHSMQEDHHVFINLETLKVYILPDLYEVFDTTLNDIKYIIYPTFTKEMVAELDKLEKFSYDLNNKRYLPGFVGLNNIKANDYVNVIVQCFSHIKPLRDFFLLNEQSGSELVKRFGILIRKMWNPRAFKGQVSPHEFLQEVTNASSKRFKLTEQSDVIEFLSWFLNSLHNGLKQPVPTKGGKKKVYGSIIHDIFQGEVCIEEQKLENVAEKLKEFDQNREVVKKNSPFMFLTLDLPTAPLYQDEMEKNIIPQIPITQLLAKYDGKTIQEVNDTLKRHVILRLPAYLILYVKRITKNNWSTQKREKNPTIVNFPIKGLDMREYVESVEENEETRYDLISSVVHSGKAAEGQYKVYVQGKADKWEMIQDLIMEEINAHVVAIAESYLMGRVRTKTVKKASRVLIEKYYPRLTLDFQTNKKICDEVAVIQSKRLRNKIAGFTTHLMKRIQNGPVRGISFKLQEEERERKDNYVPDVSALAVETIEIDADTNALLKAMNFESIPGVTVANLAGPIAEHVPGANFRERRAPRAPRQ
ncbi:hypothetical protein HK098_001646 [Nowakowskiella sp. JEL0407]|nr:hypothetical protein HK098_001646 [Nowakowskiella sp. JEL0407]